MRSRRWLSENLNLFLTLFVFLNTVFAFAGQSRTTYQAKIVKPDGYPLEASNVNFKFTILDPAGTCILYSETYSAVNMNSSGGLVSFALGSGVKTYPASATTFENVFSNITPSITCDAGGPPSYSPISTDSRKIVMQFHDGSGWQTLPAMSINAVPYAMYANEAAKLNGKTDTDFLQLSSLPTTCGVSEAIRYNGTSFSCLAVGGASTVVTSGSVITALGFTPANSASFTTVNSTIASVSSTVFSVSSTLTNLESAVTSLSNSVAASFSAIAGSGISTFNGSTSATQSLTTGVAGTAPAFVTAAGVHTLNIPYASAATTTAGLISHSDYSLFSTVVSKITSSAVALAQVLGYIPADQAQLTTLISTVGSVSSSVNTLNSNLNSVSAAVAATNSNLATTNSNIAAVSSSLATTNSNLATTNSNLSAVSSSLATTNSNLATTNSNVAAVSSAVNSLSNSTAASFASLVSSQWATSGTTLNYMTGNVGIGTVAPGYLLDVSGTVHANRFSANNGAFNNPSLTFVNNPGTGFFNNSGFLGISVNSSMVGMFNSGSLSFNAGGAGPQIYYTGGNAAQPSYAFNVDSDTGMFNPNAGGGSNELGFSTSGIERVRITSAGQVGIGISVATSPLHVVTSSSNIIGQFQTSSGTDTTSLDLFAYPADYTNAYLQDTAMLYAAGDTKNLQITAVSATGTIRFTTGGYGSVATERMRITTSGTGIGLTDPSAYLHVRAGSSTFAPLKLTSGALMASAQSGTIEYDGFNYYVTDGTNIRRAIATAAQAGTLDSVSTISSSGNVSIVPTGSVVVSSTTASTNSQTGALVVKGGLGVAGNIYASGSIVTSANIQGSEITATSATITPYIYGSVVSGGSLRLDSTTHASKGNIILAPAGGNVGIATTSPVLPLDVSGSLVVRANGAGSALWSLASPVIAGRGGLIHTQIAPESATSATSGYKEYTTGTGGAGTYKLAYISDLSSSDSVVDRLILNSAGNFGLGVTPSARLHVSGSIQTNSVNDQIYANNFTIYSSSADMKINYSSADLHINSDTTSAATFKRNGFMGLGTSNPTVKLTIDDTAGSVSAPYATATDKFAVIGTGNAVLQVTTPNTGTGGIYFSDPQSRDPGGVVYAHTTDALSFRTNNAMRMTLSASGNLGVGTTNPGYRLQTTGNSLSGATPPTNISAFANNGINLLGSISNVSQDAITYSSGGGGGAALAFRRGSSYETYMDFYTNNSVSGGALQHGMTLSHLGYLGIGTSSPVYMLDVNESNGYLRTETGDGGLEIGSGNDESSYIDFHGMNNLAADYTGRIEYKDTFGFGFTAGGLAAPALTIVSATGHVGIGLGYASNYADLYVNSNTPNGYTRIVNANAAAGGQAWTWYSSSTGAPLGANKMCLGLGACIFSLSSNGDGTLSGVFTHASDVRLKRDIATIPYALDAVTQLEGVTYYWKDPNKSAKRQVGLIAQQVEKVFPELVATDAEGFKSVAYQNLVAPMINAIKEIREWMFKTDERVLQLEKENAELKQRLENLEKSVYKKE